MQVCRRPKNYQFDQAYLDRLRNDDWQTGQHFATYFSRFLAWRMRSRYRDLDFIDDIRQETLRRVFEANQRGALREAHRLESFVSSVCNHVLLEHWRTRRKYVPADVDVENIISNSNPERTYRRLEAVHRVRTAMGTLPSRDREILWMVFIEERDAMDVSMRLKISRTYARVLLHRAIGRLRESVNVVS